MITKEQFISIINKYINWDKRIDEVGDVLNICPLEMDWVEFGAIIFTDFLRVIFTEEGEDTISWWLFERRGNPEMKMWDNEGNEIPTETVEDLWNIVKNYIK